MFSRRKAGGVITMAAALLFATAGLAGCTLIENGNGRDAFREAYENAFYDPAYESIFTDPYYEFAPPRGGSVPGRHGLGMNGLGEPPYPDRSSFEKRSYEDDLSTG